MAAKRRLIVGISGATGIQYGVTLLKLLRHTDVESHLVVTKSADLTRSYEVSLSSRELRSLADVVYPIGAMDAAIASGSFRTLGMVVIPCSVRTLAEIASGASTSLLTRSADVVLKERRRLVLVVRESPLNLIHLRNMTTVTEAGAIIAPPVPAFYTQPQSIDDIITQTVCRTLDLFDIETDQLKRWRDHPPMNTISSPRSS